MGVLELVLAGLSESLRDQPRELIELRKELDAILWVSLLLNAGDAPLPCQRLLVVPPAVTVFHETQGPLFGVASQPKVRDV